MPEDTQRGPILRGLTRVITGPGVEYPKGRLRSPTGASVFGNGRYDFGDLPIAGKTGTAQGAASLPWNDSSVFTGISLDPNRPWTVTAYLERSGYGAQAAAPVAKCMFLGLQGKIPLDPVQLSDFLDINDTVAAHDSYLADTSCLATASTERGQRD
jgi:penicillin-binding protein 2